MRGKNQECIKKKCCLQVTAFKNFGVKTAVSGIFFCQAISRWDNLRRCQRQFCRCVAIVAIVGPGTISERRVKLSGGPGSGEGREKCPGSGTEYQLQTFINLKADFQHIHKKLEKVKQNIIKVKQLLRHVYLIENPFAWANSQASHNPKVCGLHLMLEHGRHPPLIKNSSCWLYF